MERADLEQWRAREVARLFALVDTERRYYQDIVAGLPVGLLILAGDLTIRSANRFFRQTFSLRNEDILRRRVEVVLPIPDLRARVQQVVASGAAITGLVAELAAGSVQPPRTLRIGILPLRNWDDETEEALLVVEDLSGVAPAAGAARPGLAAAEPPLVEQIEAIVWEYDPAAGKFLFVNARAEEVLGFPGERWTTGADFWRERIHPLDRDWVMRYFESVIAAGEQQTCEYRAQTASGAPVWLRESVRVRRDRAGLARRVYGVATDVSADRRREEQMLNGQRVDAAARLSARLSHDLNNSLMILSGFTEEVAGALPPGSPALADVEEMRQATARMSTLAGGLFQFARKPQLDPRPLELNPFVAGLAAKIKDILGPQVEFVSRLEAGAGWVHADAEQVEHAVETLAAYIGQRLVAAGGRVILESGVEHLPTGFPAAIDGPAAGAYGFIALADNGPAMDPQTRQRLFEPFLYKEGDPLALATAYTTVEQCGGDIWVSSDEAAGTRFQILLPRVEHAHPEPVAPPPEPPPPAVPQPKRETVLVVDDESSIRMLIRKILTRHSYEVLEAVDGEDAVRALEEHVGPIHLLLTDVVLPKLGGRELAQIVRERYPELRVLFISGYNDEPMLGGGELPLHTAYLQKPFTLGSLLLKVREMLAAPRLPARE